MSRKVGARRASKVGAFGFTILAIILALMTAWLLSRMMGDTKYASEQVRNVVVAAKRIDAAVPILEDSLKVVKYPVSSIPEGAFESVDQVLGGQPRVALTTILQGEPILKPRLASPESGTGMASLIPKNRRGIAVPVDSWLADARLVYPGAYVDVMTTLRNNTERQSNTKLVLQHIRVLAVNGAVDAASMAAAEDGDKKNTKAPGSKTVVTLLVTPEESEALALASREGKIDLILRNASDEGVVETFGISASELLGEEEEEDPAASAALPGQPPVRTGRSRRARRALRPVTNPSAGQPDGPAPSRNTGGTKTIDLGAN